MSGMQSRTYNSYQFDIVEATLTGCGTTTFNNSMLTGSVSKMSKIYNGALLRLKNYITGIFTRRTLNGYEMNYNIGYVNYYQHWIVNSDDMPVYVEDLEYEVGGDYKWAEVDGNTVPIKVYDKFAYSFSRAKKDKILLTQILDETRKIKVLIKGRKRR